MGLLKTLGILAGGACMMGRLNKYLHPAKQEGYPEVYGLAYLMSKSSIETGSDVEKSCKDIEWILENLHPRHYERIKQEYEELRKKYIT